MPQFCYQCGDELTPAQHTIPAFCPHCGAPQLALSEDRSVSLSASAEATTGELPPPHPQRIDWRVAIQGSAVVAGIAGLLSLLSFRLPALTLVSWLWTVSGSLLVLESYRRRRPAARVDAAVGARIGLVFGLSLTGSLALAVTVAGLIGRFVTRSMGALDSQLTAVLQAQTAQAVATVPDPAEVVQFFSTPEFRAGLVLAVLTAAAAALLLLSTLSGALAGILGPRRRVSR